MSNIDFDAKEIIFSLDIGTRSIIGTLGVIRDKKFHIVHECYKEHEERAMIDGQIHDISLVAETVKYIKDNLEKEAGFELKNVAIAAAGRYLKTISAKIEVEIDEEKEIDGDLIRSLELSAVKKCEDEINSFAEGKLYCVGYSVKNYYLNGFIISNLLAHKGEKAGIEVISTFLPRSVADSLYAVMDKVDLNVVSLTLEPIAAMEAVVPKKLRLLNIGLIDIGAGTSDIAISSGDTISAFGMVPMAGDEVTESIVQTYLVDFNTAEDIKKAIVSKDEITYMDVLGMENTVLKEDIIKTITPVVDKIANEIASKMKELNGGKSPNAIFLVGGGAYTPMMKEFISEKLQLPPQRIAIKGREGVESCVSEDKSLGSIGVTVLGIALIALKNRGRDFIDVTLNGSVVSLFNSHRNKISDVLLNAGINPQMLIAKSGKTLRFNLNDNRRLVLGGVGENAEIKLNGKLASMELEVKEGDFVEFKPAQNGKDAQITLGELVESVYSINVTIDNREIEICPITKVNGQVYPLNEEIQNDDNVEIIYPKMLEDLIKYYNLEDTDYYKNENLVQRDYEFKDGDTIYRKTIKKDEVSKVKTTDMKVIANGEQIVLRGKESYIFVDVFDKINFDLTQIKGSLMLELNEKEASYYDKLNEGDVIKIYWK